MPAADATMHPTDMRDVLDHIAAMPGKPKRAKQSPEEILAGLETLEAVRSFLNTMGDTAQAEAIYLTTTTRGKRRKKEFVLDGLAWYVFKDRQQYTKVGYVSFNEFLKDPSSHIDGGTTYGHLTVQAVELFHVNFGIATSYMFEVGFRHFMLITPQVEGLWWMVECDALDFTEARQEALAWLQLAADVTTDALEEAIYEDKSNGAYTTYCDGAFGMGDLKSKTAQELLRTFGIDALQDESVVVIQIRGK